MSDPIIAIHRKEVAQRLQAAASQGGWEGAHTDFKRQLSSTPRDLGKVIKHVLAFANTPRRTDAYIVFGVEEDKDQGGFVHCGVPEGGFPSQQRLESLIHDHTKLRDVVVDAQHVLDHKRTPYIVVPLQHEGPCVLTRTINGAAAVVELGEVYRRYGSNSQRATERDAHRMRNDWARWFLDCRYESSANSLTALLKEHFPTYRAVLDCQDYVRLVYESEVSDEFGSHRVPSLVHAYWGFDSVPEAAVAHILADTSDRVSWRTIVGARFASDTYEAAASSAVRCIPLEEIFFVNDPYAQLCRAFIRQWRDERDAGEFMDLDYRITTRGTSRREDPRHSVLSFLEEQIQARARTAVLVHGAFGCGKTTTAKQMVAVLSEDYLRGDAEVPKVLYVNVNNIDIRSRRNECIESQLLRYQLPREAVEGIVRLARADQLHLVFDGVDEMARPYTAEGRLEAAEILREIGNMRPAAYFIRSSYYPQHSEMLEHFGRLAHYDFAAEEKRLVAAEILPLRREQVARYLDSRIGRDDANKVRTELQRAGMESFLTDPLIISMVANLVEEYGTKAVESLPSGDQKAQLLSLLVRRLLDREQDKRERHGIDFAVFQRVLRATAFRMVSAGVAKLDPDRFGAVIQGAMGPSRSGSQAVDEFRTTSWIQRLEDGSVAFRHEALTIVCAAEHVCAAFENQDALSLSEWQPTAPLVDLVAEYAGKMIGNIGLLGAMALLGTETPFNVRQLVSQTIGHSRATDAPQRVPVSSDARFLGNVLRGVGRAPQLATPVLNVLFSGLAQKRAIEIGVPLIFLLRSTESPDALRVASRVLNVVCGDTRNFGELLRKIRSEKTTWLDTLLLKNLSISEDTLLDGDSYEGVFRRLQEWEEIETRLKHYAERTLAAIEGERYRRTARLKTEHKHKRRRRRLTSKREVPPPPGDHEKASRDSGI